MQQLKEYVISVVAAAVIVGIITGLLHKKDMSAILIRMIGGLFLAFTVIRPVVAMDIADIGSYIAAFSESGADAVQEGEKLADDAYRMYIKSKTEAYILDKAAAFGGQLEVEVTLDEEDIPVPVSIRIEGNVSPYAKASLREMMVHDLGILEENQLWIG